MNIPSDRHALDELLAQAGWMRALARSLVADPQAAEDVVQDAWVVALAKRAAVRTDLVGWLRSVVRNLALRRNAREGRRLAVERGAARAEHAEGGDPAGELRGAFERMELQRWLAEALLELSEPARSAVILRHVDGLDPGEIACRLGCSREAARQRVARGLAELRRRLDARPGGRAAWCLMLAPWTHGPRPLPFSWTTGGILMGSKALLASFVALAVAALWFALGRDGSVPGRERAALGAALPPAQLERVPPEEPEETGTATSEPRREALASAPPAAAALESPPENPLFARLAGRVVDGAGAPIAGAEVAARRPEVGHFSVLDLELRKNPRTTARAVTGADGRFAFELERGIPLELALTARGFCDELLQGCYAGQELEVVLDQGLRVHGRVTRLADGAPIADARVRVFQLGRAGGERTTTSAADGRFELRTTFRTDALIEVIPLRERSSEWIRLVFDATGSAEANVALPDGIEVRGRVVAADTGAPIAGAEVGEGWTFRRHATTDARGEYVLSGFGSEGRQELFARAAGFGRGQRASLPPAADGVMRVDFELARGHAARGRVLDAARAPLVGAYVAAVASEFGPEGQETDWVSGRTDFAGRFELTGLSPAVPHALVASADGFATHVFDFPAEELTEAELELGDFVLGPAALLSGTVADEDGAPLAGVEVVLEGANRDRGRLRPTAGNRHAGDWYVASREGRTDARGRFAFGSLPAGEFRLHARADGRPESPELAVALAEGELRDDCALLYPRGEEIRGTLVDAEGHGLAGVYVSAELRAARAGAVGQRRPEVQVQTGADGGFELLGLPPGTWSLDFQPYGLAGDPDAPWLPTSLAGVESRSAHDAGEPLRVVLPRGASIRGRLLDAEGAALVGYYVSANRPGSGGDGRGHGDASAEDGSFRIEVEPGTVWDLEVRGAPQSQLWGMVFHTELGIAAGTRELVLRVADAPR